MVVNRPFLLCSEPSGSSTDPEYISRNLCRAWAFDVIEWMKLSQARSLVQPSWPFTVYAVVNALLIVWYDFSAPLGQQTSHDARRGLFDIIDILRAMGRTWWAAAAKHKLAEALLKIGDRLHDRTRTKLDTIEMDAEGAQASLVTPASVNDFDTGISDSGASRGWGPAAGQNGNEFLQNDADFWEMLGLDFDTDLANGIFSIS